MHFPAFTTFALLLGSAVAQVVPADTKTSYQTKCFTKMASKSAKHVPTQRVTKVKTLPYQTITGYSHSTTTVTPLPKTITITRLSEVKTTTTQGYTTTETFTATETSTVIQTSTAIETQSTTVTSTTLYQTPTPAGFRYAADTTARPQARRWEEFNDVVKRVARKQGEAKGCKTPSYPESVTCTITKVLQPIKKKIVPGKVVTKIAIKPIQLTTTVETLTSVSTQLPATVTSTATESTTVSTTQIEQSMTIVSSTVTDTATVTSTQTGYAACATNNIIPSVNGQAIVNAYNNGGGGSTYYTTSGTSADACCEVCQQNDSAGNGCQSFVFTNGRCIILYNRAGTCNAGQEQGYWILGSGSGYTVGNGPCGYFYAQGAS
ncbi:hypothetical protein SLS60_001342 [Paraconiothyrium brasiliense]|uniref:Apple domain-containing protein n=1 Tax=Paraconiothyrium brasiliense TaxID=300254 RepID=A0ABR3S903_9PLEO